MTPPAAGASATRQRFWLRQGISAWALFMAVATASAQDLPAAQGEVRRVDKANGKITLRHGEIKNLNMPPMTMVFLVKDLAWLEQVQPGVQVIFTADQVDGQYTVMSLSPRP